MTPANAVCHRGKCASGWLRCLINPTPFSSVMLHSGLVAIADCVRYIVGHFDDGICKSANLFLAQTPLVALSDFGKRPHHFVWSLCSCGQPCLRLKPAATVWHNLRQLLLRDQMLGGYLSHFFNLLPHQFIDWTILIECLDIGTFYAYYCSNQSSTITNFNNLLIWSLAISPPISSVLTNHRVGITLSFTEGIGHLQELRSWRHLLVEHVCHKPHLQSDCKLYRNKIIPMH